MHINPGPDNNWIAGATPVTVRIAKPNKKNKKKSLRHRWAIGCLKLGWHRGDSLPSSRSSWWRCSRNCDSRWDEPTPPRAWPTRWRRACSPTTTSTTPSVRRASVPPRKSFLSPSNQNQIKFIDSNNLIVTLTCNHLANDKGFLTFEISVKISVKKSIFWLFRSIFLLLIFLLF